MLMAIILYSTFTFLCRLYYKIEDIYIYMCILFYCYLFIQEVRLFTFLKFLKFLLFLSNKKKYIYLKNYIENMKKRLLNSPFAI